MKLLNYKYYFISEHNFKNISKRDMNVSTILCSMEIIIKFFLVAGTLCKISVDRQLDFTPKSQKLCTKATKFKIHRNGAEVKDNKIRKNFFFRHSSFADRANVLSPEVKKYVESQMCAIGKSARGRRLTFNDKCLALSIFEYSKCSQNRIKYLAICSFCHRNEHYKNYCKLVR